MYNAYGDSKYCPGYYRIKIKPLKDKQLKPLTLKDPQANWASRKFKLKIKNSMFIIFC
jgi:hypothetical protein